MEADWEVEVGDGAPVIDACWPGFVDLRQHPERVGELSETVLLLELAAALQELNGPASPVWTSKCDFYPALLPAEFDADELDAGDEDATCAAACYIDLLPVMDGAWATPGQASEACKQICSRLRLIRLRRCRVDLVVRRALIAPTREVLGITSYITACAGSADEAKRMLELALPAFVRAVLSKSKLQ